MYVIKDKFSLLFLSGVFSLVAVVGLVMSKDGFDSTAMLIASDDDCGPDEGPPGGGDDEGPPNADAMPIEIVG